jgi:hypothetical protein
MNALMILGALVGFFIGSGPGGHEICLQGLQESLSQPRRLKNVRLSQPNPTAKP